MTFQEFIFSRKKLISLLKEKFPEVVKCYYFSDGAAGQYKNKKNFVNLANHEKDFGVLAEWYFFATNHGKGPCDGVGGTIKRLAAYGLHIRSCGRLPLDCWKIDPFTMFHTADSLLYLT